MTPLAGIRIVDLTHALAGPFCTYHLAQFGAEVTKVEPPGTGDDFRAFAPDTFDAVNGGKRSVVIDLKSEQGRAELDAMLADADVLVENFRPGVADAFGLTWDRLHARNPRLIFCSISGFGSTGPRARWPAVEWSVQAAMGISDLYLDDDADPRDLGLGVLDIFSGTSAIIAILAALAERARVETGHRLEVTMADAALTLAGPTIAPQMAGRRVGKLPRRAAVGRFRARDRRLFVMAPHQRWFDKVAQVLGAPLLTDDPRFATPAAREAHAEDLRQAIEDRLATRDADAWQTDLLAAGVPAAAVVGLLDVVASGYFAGTGMLHETYSHASDHTVLTVGATFSGRTIARAPGDVPKLGGS